MSCGVHVVGRSSGVAVAPGTSREPDSSSKVKNVWNSGVRLRSRWGCAASTIRSNDRRACVSASACTVPTRGARRDSESVSPSSTRSGTVFSSGPTRLAPSECHDAGTATPTAMSRCCE